MTMTREPAIQRWSDWITGLRDGCHVVPEEVSAHSSLRAVDVLGCAAGGLQTPGIEQLLYRHEDPTLTGARAVQLVAPDARVATVDATDLAMVLAAAAHCTDFDDSHFASLTHPSLRSGMGHPAQARTPQEARE
jgi:2-methylcitrate dehydratase PrpD